MTTFDDEALFNCGVTEVRAGPMKLRHTIQELPGSQGARLDIRGKQARRIEQSGHLIADTPEALRALVNAIQNKLDGLAHVLIDSRGTAWPNCVMTEFEPGLFVRVGARWKVTYRIEYIQVKP